MSDNQPQIYVSNITAQVPQGSQYDAQDILDQISAYAIDSQGNDISDLINVETYNLDLSTPGYYTGNLSVEDPQTREVAYSAFKIQVVGAHHDSQPTTTKNQEASEHKLQDQITKHPFSLMCSLLIICLIVVILGIVFFQTF